MLPSEDTRGANQNSGTANLDGNVATLGLACDAVLVNRVALEQEQITALVTSRQRPERHLQNILQSTRGIAFLGTPHHGSGLARWAELLSPHIGLFKQTDTEIVAVLQRESEVLAQIQEGFHTMVIARGDDGQGKIEITCFFEELPLRGIGQVVPQGAAILPGYIPIGIHSNHMDMARFVSADDPGLNKSVLVPYTSNSDFVGRSEILERLKWQLGHGQPSTCGTLQPRTCLYGLGGIGKTQIALAYVFWLRETHPDISIFWVHASTAERFRQAYTSIAQECQVAGFDDQMTKMLPLVKKWLERKDRGRWLLVIDNADDKEVFFGQKTGSAADEGSSGHERNLGRYIPQYAPGAILVTTRNLQTGSSLTKGKNLIEVGKMNEDETAQLLRICLDGVDTTSGGEFSTLSTRLEHLPLGLVQATADQNLIDLLGEEFETEGRDSETPHAVAETWMLSFEQIQRQNSFAGELLSIMSLFDRHAIPLEFLLRYSQQRGGEQNGEIELTKALGILKAFRFVTEDKGHGFDMHRLIQLVTQTWLSRKGMKPQFAEQALLLVSEVYPFGNHETRAICSAYLPHANAESIIRASLLHRIGGLYDYQAEILKAVLGEEHPDTLASITNLASIYGNQGRSKEAENLEVQVVEARKRVLGEEHPNTLNRRWKEAENLGAQVVEASKRVLGEEHPDTLNRRWKEAENLEVQVVEARKRILGEEHPDTLNSIANLSSTYWSQRRLKEAEELEVQLVETRKRVLGEEHPAALNSITNLAMAYLAVTWERQGRLKDAVDLMQICFHHRQQVLGEDHPGTASTLSLLTEWQKDINKMETEDTQ
ncbi:hypothetical protein C7999DRAFT_41647 [Corynascus novoguineensis]|uniref:Kinesin light chain n=1 Tax=Corynascus novoguineensis TaxID=1126955 RepID=A0AAN7HPM3_9PEZI|nr:hypothetical protein C7999DRAFT_41647 [Corynascus novoguineensis]